MAHFWGRRSDDTATYGEITRAEVAGFIDQCQADGWRRVAVAEHLSIIGAWFGGDVWLHPQLRGDN